MLQTVAEIAALARDEAELSATVGRYCLLGPPRDVLGHEDGWAFRTRSVQTDLVTIGRANVSVTDEDIVLPCRKRPDSSSFGGVVLVGRASSNDVEIMHASVSKLHAQIKPQALGALLSDCDSSNGTFVDEVRLEPGEERLVASGAEVRFGLCKFVLLSLDALRLVLARQQLRG